MWTPKNSQFNSHIPLSCLFHEDKAKVNHNHLLRYEPQYLEWLTTPMVFVQAPMAPLESFKVKVPGEKQGGNHFNTIITHNNSPISFQF